MKKLLFVLSTFIGVHSFAQTSVTTFGAKGGVNFSSISNKGYDDTKTRTGFHAGLFANMPISDNFSIQPEVLYSQEGAKVTRTYNSAKISSKLNLDYVQVPIMFQVRPVKQFYIEAGPQFGFLVNAKAKGDLAVGNNNVANTTLDVKDQTKSFNFGLGAGLGYDITENIGIGARYNFGLSDINKNGNTNINNPDNKNRLRNFQVSAYFKF